MMSALTSRDPEMKDEDHKIHASDFPGPNPDPIPPDGDPQLATRTTTNDVKSTPSSPVPVVTIGPPPDGGKEAWLVVLGGFILMYVSFGFSEFAYFLTILRVLMV